MKLHVLGIALLLAGAADVAAQTPSHADAMAIEAAAAGWVRDRLPKDGPIGLARAAFSHGDRKPVGRDAVRIAALAAALAATDVDEDSVYRCTTSSPKSCELDVEVLVRIGAPVIKGDSARIEVQQRYRWQPAPGSPMGPVGLAIQELILSREKGSWRVVRLGYGSTS